MSRARVSYHCEVRVENTSLSDSWNSFRSSGSPDKCARMRNSICEKSVRRSPASVQDPPTTSLTVAPAHAPAHPRTSLPRGRQVSTPPICQGPWAAGPLAILASARPGPCASFRGAGCAAAVGCARAPVHSARGDFRKGLLCAGPCAWDVLANRTDLGPFPCELWEGNNLRLC